MTKLASLPFQSKLISKIRGLRKYNQYAVDIFGNIWSIKYSNEWRKRKLVNCKSGHKRVELSYNDITEKIFVHRLVALAFIPNPEKYPCVNHKDSNPANNNVSNLEWCSHSMNSKHCVAYGRGAKGEKVKTSKLTEDQVREIRVLRNEKKMILRDVAKVFNIHLSLVSLIAKGKAWAHVS